ncbi:translation initiation factor eIF-2B subunit alpha [Malassezia sp. CBS 17886]|nr:translation initiation factor eIF-2B subunit alpha [Malassezia sp. CBS 17886]
MEAAPHSVVDAFQRVLSEDEEMPMPIAAIFALSEMVAKSKAETTSELMESIKQASEELRASLANPIPASAGLELYMRFVTTKNWAGGDFRAHKQSLIASALEFAHNTVPNCRERITELLLPFIKDDTVIMTHSYSRVVMQVLLAAVKTQGKRISVYVTESRPSGNGLLTYQRLRAAGIPCTVVADAAVAYIMHKVDMCLIGAEGVAESGGLFNAVGSYQMGIIAKAAHKPLFAVAESFKFMRLFPLSQYDVPIAGKALQFPEEAAAGAEVINGDARAGATDAASSDGSVSPIHTPTRTSAALSYAVTPLSHMTPEMEADNPSIDYTLPELVSFIVSDIGILTPSGVSDALLAGGEVVYGKRGKE